MNTTKLQRRTAEIKAQRVAGHVNWSPDGDEAYIWTQTAWCASVTVSRGDMSQTDFTRLVLQIAETAKGSAK